MRIVQVCNVGNICGGTAACVWTITRALPQCQHSVLCLRPPTEETVRAFAPVPIQWVSRVDDDVLAPFQPDLVILHNTSAEQVGQIRDTFSLQYQHSAGVRAEAEMTVACSQWLAGQIPRSPEVLYQPVPTPPHPADGSRSPRLRHLEDQLVIGRICTPQLKKWPVSCIAFYRHLAARCPRVNWEFVGCPTELQQPLSRACGDRIRFFPAGWLARQHLWRWHGLLYHHPTLTESFGRTVAEAMRAGCVPIVDGRGGFCEQIEDNRSGFLCHSIDDFCAAISKLNDPASRWERSRIARKTSDGRFSLATFSKRFLQLLSEKTKTF